MKKYFAIIKVLNSITSEVFLVGAEFGYDNKVSATSSLEHLISFWSKTSYFKVLDKKVFMKKFEF